jgi:steroid delta-isomerase-like uncharacterized protein
MWTDGFRFRSYERTIGGDQGKPPHGEESYMLTAQDIATLVRAHYDAFNSRDINKQLSLVTQDAKWTNIPFNVEHKGHKGYREFAENWTTAMPDCKVEVLNLIQGEHWMVVECVAKGTHTGPLTGPQGTIPATQKKVDLKFCELLRIKDGQIDEARVYFDAATMMRQLGLMPHTPASGELVTNAR